jgi:hypothetical protein
MKLLLSAASFQELLANDSPDGWPIGGSRPWPARIRRGTFECIEIRPGVVA